MPSAHTPITRIYLVRHGETALSIENRFAGSMDIPLSEAGNAQVRRLAERLKGESVTAVYSSPQMRTMETAAILAKPHKITVEPCSGLREISHGHWESMTLQEVEVTYPEETAAWEEDPYTFAPEGGESGLAVTARALPAFMEIVKGHPGENVIVVSHKATIRLLLSSLLGFDPRRYRDSLDQNPAALNIIDFRNALHARLSLYNDTSHYSMSGLAIPERPWGRLSRWWSGNSGGGNR